MNNFSYALDPSLDGIITVESYKVVRLPPIDKIVNTVAVFYRIDPLLLKTHTRKREIVEPRQIAMYFAKKLTGMHLASIGQRMGDFDHATVLHACRTVRNLSETDKSFRVKIKEIGMMLNAC